MPWEVAEFAVVIRSDSRGTLKNTVHHADPTVLGTNIPGVRKDCWTKGIWGENLISLHFQ